MTLVLRSRAPYRGGLRRFFENTERFLPSPGAQKTGVRAGWYPRFSITNGADSISFKAELPEAGREGLAVSASQGSLVVRGTSDYEQAVEREGYRYSEQGSRSFSRRFPLPDNADWEATAACFDEGVLTVTVPLAPAGAPRRIRVRAASAGAVTSSTVKSLEDMKEKV